VFVAMLTAIRKNALRRNLFRNTSGLHSSSSKSPKNIEDDGYSYYKQKTLWERAATSFTDNPNPGTLILVRHGETISISMLSNMIFYRI
jgi:hypothetical protein